MFHLSDSESETSSNTSEDENDTINNETLITIENLVESNIKSQYSLYSKFFFEKFNNSFSLNSIYKSLAEKEPMIKNYLIKKQNIIKSTVDLNQNFLNWLTRRYDAIYQIDESESVSDEDYSEDDDSSSLNSVNMNLSFRAEERDQEVEDMDDYENDDYSDDFESNDLDNNNNNNNNSNNSNNIYNSEEQTTDDESEITYSEIVEFIDKIFNLLLLFLRDWSAERKTERDICYRHFIQTLNDLYPNEENRKNLTVVLPGGGMGRLSYEVACLGFNTIHNELSIFINIALKAFFFGGNIEKNSHKIAPFIHTHKNILDLNSLTTEISIPDIPVQTKTNLSFRFGDFHKKFKDPQSLDCVCTSFFIDTVRDITKTIQHIHTILKPSGIWINNGPLHYHHSINKSDHLNVDDINFLLINLGFSVLDFKIKNCEYTTIRNSMTSLEFGCIWFVVQKI